MENQGASVVITHDIVAGKEKEYEDWLNEIGPACRRAAGNIDWQIIRPIPGLTFSFTIIVRFDTIEHLKRWMESDERRGLIEQIAPILAKKDNYYIKSGLDFLFLSESANNKVPLRWKQYLATWSAIYPLSAFLPLVIVPALRLLHFPQNRYLDAFFVSGSIVFLMVYLVMPNYTRLIKKWLYKQA